MAISRQQAEELVNLQLEWAEVDKQLWDCIVDNDYWLDFCHDDNSYCDEPDCLRCQLQRRKDDLEWKIKLLSYEAAGYDFQELAKAAHEKDAKRSEERQRRWAEERRELKRTDPELYRELHGDDEDDA